jgi:hypothetical protein
MGGHVFPSDTSQLGNCVLFVGNGAYSPKGRNNRLEREQPSPPFDFLAGVGGPCGEDIKLKQWVSRAGYGMRGQSLCELPVHLALLLPKPLVRSHRPLLPERRLGIAPCDDDNC